MKVADVMDEVAARLASCTGLQGRTFAYPPSSVVPPVACVGWPDEIDYDVTASQGAASMTLPVLIVVGKADTRSARDALAGYLDGSGPASVRAALGGDANSAYHSARVTKAHVDPVSIAGIEYLAAILDVEIVGGI